MEIGCLLILEDGTQKRAVVNEEQLLELSKTLRTTGKEWVHTKDKSFEIEGIYIPSKDSKLAIITLPSEE